MSDAAEDLLAFVADELDAAVREVRSRTAGLALDVEPLLAGTERSLHRQLLRLIERSLMLELHAAGMLGLLEGGDSSTRFTSFVGRLHDAGVRAEVHDTYPLLRPEIDRIVDHWSSATIELLERIDADRAVISEAFAIDSPATAIEVADSDPHRCGRRVCIVTFGGTTRLVYKPRSMAVDVSLAELVIDLGLDLRVPRTLDRGEHGWAEYVEQAPCTDEQQVATYHERLGAWIAVLWAIGGTDVHFENIVAAGEHPVPIDLETLLHPRLFVAPTDDADSIAQDQLDESVHGVGILPTPQWDAATGAIVDFSGVGAGAGESTGATTVDAGTDRMRIDVGTIRAQRSRNEVLLGGVPVDPRAFVMPLERGYRDACRRIVAAGPQLLDRFRTTPIRVLVRPTRWYVALLDQLHHPHALADAGIRDESLTQLEAHLELQEWRRPMIGAERFQLERGDVPAFEALPGSRDLLVHGAESIQGVIGTTGIELAERRIAQLAEVEGDRLQLWTLRVSMATKAHGERVDEDAIRGDSLLEVAVAAGDRLAARAIEHEDRASWHALRFASGPDDPDDAWSASLVGDDLYDGLVGITLFLATLARVAGTERHDRLARAAWANLERRATEPIGVGAFAGAAGHAYASVMLAEWWDRHDLLDRATLLATRIRSGAQHDQVLDVVAGCAGAVPALLAVDARIAGDAARHAAVACGERLLDALPDLEQLPMRRGYSHGPSGVALALALLAARTSDLRFADAARTTLLAEDELIRATVWSDNDVPGHEQFAWCHGSPGIALARLQVAELLDDDMLRGLAAGAIERAAQAPPQVGDGLCHGTLGNAEAFVQAAALDAPRWSDVLDSRIEHVLDRARTSGMSSLAPRGIHAPGLMTGIAGIGMGALRLHAPDATPSVLTLQAPGSMPWTS